MALGVTKLKYLRSSARKARLLTGILKGKDVNTALDMLKHIQKATAHPIGKALASCVANVTSQKKIDASELFISKIYADEGPTLKRYRAQTMGRSSAVKKRTTHITIEIDKR